MNKLVKRVIQATGKYSLMDFGCLKFTILSAGILLGAYFPDFFINYTSLLWAIFILALVWIMYRTVFKHMA